LPKFFIIVFCFFATSYLASCRAKVGHDLDRSKFNKAAAEDPTEETPDEDIPEDETPDVEEPEPKDFRASRTHFQTRSVIGLGIENEILTGKESLSIVNETTGKALLNDTPYISLNWSVSEVFEYSLLGSASLWLSINPANFIDGLAYGEPNFLVMLVDGEPTPAFAGAEITVKDFRIFSPQATRFTGNRQKKGGFQGWLNPIGRGGRSKSGGKLTSGFSNVIND
jgi:hypothetical protein